MHPSTPVVQAMADKAFELGDHEMARMCIEELCRVAETGDDWAYICAIEAKLTP